MRAVDFEHNDSRTRSKKLGAALCRRCDPLTIRPIDRARPSFDHFNCYSTILHCALNRPLIVGDMGHLLCFAGFLYSKNVKHEIKFLWPMASVSVDLLTSERETACFIAHVVPERAKGSFERMLFLLQLFQSDFNQLTLVLHQPHIHGV